MKKHLILLEADNGANATSGTASEEPRTLAAAKALLATERETIATLNASHEALAAERDSLAAQFETLTAAAAEKDTSITALQAEISEAKIAASAAAASAALEQEKLTTAAANIERLEKLCGVKGIDPKAAIASGSSDPVAGDTESRIADLQSQLSSASPTEKFNLAVQIRKLRDSI